MLGLPAQVEATVGPGLVETLELGCVWSRFDELRIVLRFLGDLPYADIAAALDCSEPAARQNVRAGLASLRVEVTR